MKLMHNGLKDLLLLEEYVKNKKIGFLSLETTIPEWLKKITKLIPIYPIQLQIRREYRHVAMGLRALKLKDVDTIFIFEAYNQHLFILLPLLTLMALQGKEILISLHGNQQFAMSSVIKYWGLVYLKIYLQLFKNLKVINLEIKDDIIPEKFRLPSSSQFIIPHPMISDVKPKLSYSERFSPNTPIKIGVVGMIRKDKPISKLLEKIQEYQSSSSYPSELIIGTPFYQKPKDLDQLKATLYDTTKESDYLKVLQKIDILLVYYDKDKYYYRASGVISDAASSGCYIIASDYPVIKHQINYPVKIGSTFANFEEIPSLIDHAIIEIQKIGQDNHLLWREKRNAEAIAKILFN